MNQIEDMRQLIRDEIQNISSLEERVHFKDMMEGIFLALYETNERMYQTLETRVMDDLAFDLNRHMIRTGLVERAYLDKSHHLMSAMCEEDTNPVGYTAGEIRTVLAETGRFCLSTVFFQCDAMRLSSILEKEETYPGIFKVDVEYSIPVYLERSKRYLDQVEQLYHLFIKNGIPWQTINIPYLFKMVDVYITELPDEIPDHVSIEQVLFDFGDDNQLVQYDLVPIWNVRHEKLNSFGFPIPCEDHKNYEHVIGIHEYGTDHAYLIEEQAQIISVRLNKGRLMVTGAVSEPQKWQVCMILAGKDYKIDRYTYPIMENLRKDSFSERYARKTGQKIRTRAELERFIKGFMLEDYIEYQGFKLRTAGSCETYSMNFFVEDEIREHDSNKVLTLYFKGQDKMTWLLRDLASFIVSELQVLYPEYQCRGSLI